MNKEAIELLEKALEIFSWCQEHADEKWMIDHLAAVRIDIDQTLTILKQQPPAGEFTNSEFIKGARALLRQGVDDAQWEYATLLRKACARLDRAEASNQDLLTACDIFQESIYQLSEGLCILCGGEDYPVCGDKKGYDEVDAEDAEEWRLAHKESCPLIIFEAAIAKALKE